MGSEGTREYHDFPSNFFLSHSVEKFHRGTFQCVTNFENRKILWIRESGEGGSIKIFRQLFFVSQWSKISWGNPVVFHYFRVSKKFMDKRGGGKEGEKEEVSKCSVESFLSHGAKIFVKEPFSVSLFSGTKMLGINHKKNWQDRDSNPEATA